MNSKLAYTIPNTLNKYVKRDKDQLNVLLNQEVYKIFCEDCEASYVGQTKRKLKIRLQEHELDINKNTGSSTIITNSHHRIEYNFDWNNVKILDKEFS